MSSVFPAISEEDLHALVDGELDGPRQEAVLRHVAVSPADQAKVDGWRQQNMRLRAAFASVSLEPVPLALSFALCATVLPVPNAPQPPTAKPGRREPWFVGAVAATLIFALFFGGAIWLELSKPWTVASSPSHPEAAVFDAPAVARQLAQALAQNVPADHSRQSGLRRDASAVLQSPNLIGLGLRLTAATVVAFDGGPLGCFAFLGNGEDRFVLCIAGTARDTGFDFRTLRAPSAAPLDEVRSNQSKASDAALAISWQDQALLYALAGSVDTDQLRDTARRIRAALASSDSAKH